MTSVQSLSLVFALATLMLIPGSPDPILTLFSGATLIFGLYLLWPMRGTPVLLLPFLLQWLPVATKPVQSALTGLPINSLGERGANLAPAAWFGLGALCCLAAGMRWAGYSGRRNLAWEMQADARSLTGGFVLRASLAAIVGGHFLEIASGYAGPARQPLLMLSTAQLAGLFILIYWCLSQQRAFGLMSIVLAFEIVYGMMGYYGEFGPTLLIMIVAVLAAKSRASFSALVLGAAVFSFLLTLVVFWSAIKPSYRNFQDSAGPNLSIASRLDYLTDAALTIDAAGLDAGLEAFVSRLSYIDFLAHALVYVPDYHPYSGGGQTFGAIKHILTPRLLFHNKPPAPHDTFVTMQYTGLSFNSPATTSISLGYLGEFYVDFGWIGAMIAMLGLGAAIGWGYKYLLSYRQLPTLFNVALATMAVIPFAYFERALLKLLGGGLTLFIACVLLQRLIMPRALSLLATNRDKRLLRSARRAASAGHKPLPRQQFHVPRGRE